LFLSIKKTRYSVILTTVACGVIFAGAPRPGHVLSGGMFYHVGAGVVSAGPENITGLSTGLGGRIAFTVLQRLRIGGIGFNTGFNYRSAAGIDGSYVNLKFGGLTAEFGITFKALRISPGICIGGGALRHLNIVGIHDDGKKLVTYEKNGTVIVMPMLLFEYAATESISVAWMGDWIFGTQIVSGNSFGPRAHIGVLFNR